MCHEGLAAHEHKVCDVPLQQLRVARHILQHLAAALQMGCVSGNVYNVFLPQRIIQQAHVMTCFASHFWTGHSRISNTKPY